MKRDFQNEFDDIVKEIIIPFFKELGFKRNGKSFNKKINDIVQVINIQKSQWNHQDNLSFTFNIGFLNEDIYRERWNKEAPKFVRVYDCQIHFRLGQLTKKMDYWYELNENRERIDLGNEIMNHLIKYLKPILDDNQTLNSLKDFLKRYESFKLTMPTIDQILLLLKTGGKEEAEKFLRDEYKEALNPKESTSIINYPDGRKEIKIYEPSINKGYVDKLKKLAATNNIDL